MSSIVEVKNLVKRYNKENKNSVDDVSFAVEEGSFFAFLGPSGAGKTTVLSILTTTLQKTRGGVKIAGLDINKDQNQIRKHIGIIFQNSTLDNNLTGEENVRIHVGLYGTYPFRFWFNSMDQAYKNTIMELAHVLGLENQIHKLVKNYSGGMRRKLEIIRSLMHNPHVLFLDEPTTGLDAVTSAHIGDYLQNFCQKTNATVFFTTQSIAQAQQADRVAILSKGKIIMDDTPQAIEAQLTKSTLILIAAKTDSLGKDLKQQGLEYIFDGLRFYIDLTEEVDVQRIIKTIETPLSLITILKPTLEEGYLTLISH